MENEEKQNKKSSSRHCQKPDNHRHNHRLHRLAHSHLRLYAADMLKNSRQSRSHCNSPLAHRHRRIVRGQKCDRQDQANRSLLSDQAYRNARNFPSARYTSRISRKCAGRTDYHARLAHDPVLLHNGEKHEKRRRSDIKRHRRNYPAFIGGIGCPC